MKNAIRQILGKTISGVIVKQHPSNHPSSKGFLLFDDDTHYELWTNGLSIREAGGVDPGGRERVLASGREGA